MPCEFLLYMPAIRKNIFQMEYQLFFYIQLSAAYSNILQQDYPFYIVLKDHIQIYLVSFQCPRYKNRQLTIANYHLLSFPLYIRKEFQIEKLNSLLICQYLKVYVRPLLFQIISNLLRIHSIQYEQ